MEDYQSILEMDIFELLDWLSQRFSVKLPNKVETAEQMNEASELLLKLTSYHSYLCELLSYAKVAVRYAKRNYSKTDWEDYVDKQNAIDRWLDIIKQQYTALSRAVTIRTENNKELFMLKDSI